MAARYNGRRQKHAAFAGVFQNPDANDLTFVTSIAEIIAYDRAETRRVGDSPEAGTDGPAT
jgi:hypothetical protein